MTEKEIFTHLFSIAPQSSDTDGVVTCCLVRDGEIVADAVSAGVRHAEYELLQKLSSNKTEMRPGDILYVTLQPCDRRSTSDGEALGDCTTNTIAAGVKNVVYAATYPKSLDSLNRFKEAGVSIKQCEDIEIVRQAVNLFNSTNGDTAKHIPVP